MRIDLSIYLSIYLSICIVEGIEFRISLVLGKPGG